MWKHWCLKISTKKLSTKWSTKWHIFPSTFKQNRFILATYHHTKHIFSMKHLYSTYGVWKTYKTTMNWSEIMIIDIHIFNFDPPKSMVWDIKITVMRHLISTNYVDHWWITGGSFCASVVYFSRSITETPKLKNIL